VSFEFVELDVATPTDTRVLNWVSDCIVVENNTPYPLYINWKTAMLPNTIAYDKLIPGGMFTVFAAVGNHFAFFLDTGGGTNPAVGQRCNIGIQADEIIPTFSQANWRSSFNSPLTSLVTVGTFQQVINTAGANGVFISINASNAVITTGIRVLIEFSSDGVIYTTYKIYQVLPNVNFTRLLPASVNFIRVTISLLDTSAGASMNVRFTYSLTQFFSEITPKYRGDSENAFVAALASGAVLATNIVQGAQKVFKVFVYFQLPTVVDRPTFTLQLAGSLGVGIGSARWFFLNNPSGSGLSNAFDVLGQYTPHLIHRRLTEWGWEIETEWDTIDTVILQMQNLSGVAMSNVVIGYDTKIEM
jgi:hypothetical protein